MAILEGNDVIFMDEPSTGMDPSARRKLWKIIKEETVEKKKALLLTTHSMDEAENVCNRIGIMVRSFSHSFTFLLKNHYSLHYLHSFTFVFP